MVKDVWQFQIIGDRRMKTPTYNIYAFGEEDSHVMNWNGCNYRRARVSTGERKFTSLREAMDYAVAHFHEFESIANDVKGEHVGDWNPKEEMVLADGAGDKARLNKPVADIFIGPDGEMTQEAWDRYRTGVKHIEVHRELQSKPCKCGHYAGSHIAQGGTVRCISPGRPCDCHAFEPQGCDVL